MEYRNLGRTGTKVSMLCFGCMNFGHATDDATAAQMVDRAIDAGINFFDSADVYSSGGSEEALGKALKANGKREHVLVATKVHGEMSRTDPNLGGIHRRHIIEGCHASLRRLQTDYIDLYQLHRPDPQVPVDESLRALDDLVRAGKVRYLGVSTFPTWRTMEMLWAAREFSLNRVVCEQSPYNLLDRRIERELVPMAQSYGLAIIPWSPLASGFLSGKYERANPEAAGGRLSSRPTWIDNHFTDAAYAVIEVVRALAREKGATPGQVALAWCARQPGITSPIMGPRTMEQLEDNLGAINIAISDEDRKRLDAVSPPGMCVVRYYESSTWGPTAHRW